MMRKCQYHYNTISYRRRSNAPGSPFKTLNLKKKKIRLALETKGTTINYVLQKLQFQVLRFWEVKI